MVQRALDVDRLVVVILPQQRAAVRALERAAGLERGEIGADRDRRGGEPCRQRLHRDLAMLAQQFHDAVASFRDQESWLGAAGGLLRARRWRLPG